MLFRSIDIGVHIDTSLTRGLLSMRMSHKGEMRLHIKRRSDGYLAVESASSHSTIADRQHSFAELISHFLPQRDAELAFDKALALLPTLLSG